jgi:hypothetical protein
MGEYTYYPPDLKLTPEEKIIWANVYSSALIAGNIEAEYIADKTILKMRKKFENETD